MILEYLVKLGKVLLWFDKVRQGLVKLRYVLYDSKQFGKFGKDLLWFGKVLENFGLIRFGKVTLWFYEVV